MKSLFEPEAYQEIRSRLNNLSESSEKQWGKMEPGQMIFHCQGPLNIMLGKEDYGFKPNWLVKVLFKKSLYNDKPWKKNLPTAKALRVTEPKNLDSERAKLEGLLNEFESHHDRKEWNPHPAFGTFTRAQWGQMQYKHLDHHLKQFGV